MNTGDYAYETKDGELVILPDCLSYRYARRWAYALAYQATHSELAAVTAADSVKPLRKQRWHRSRTTQGLAVPLGF
jgi:hypothetical protein